jgi:hypothetical protein
VKVEVDEVKVSEVVLSLSSVRKSQEQDIINKGMIAITRPRRFMDTPLPAEKAFLSV